MVLKERNAKTSLFWRCLLLGPKTTAKNLWFETNLRSVAQFVLKWEPFKETVSMGKDSQICIMRNSCFTLGCECVNFFTGLIYFFGMSKNRFLRAFWNFFQNKIIFSRSWDTSILYVTTELVHPVAHNQGHTLVRMVYLASVCENTMF